MYKVILINMPFANVSLPSLALAQLNAMLDSRFQNQVEVEILHLNHDFARHIGMDLYDYIVGSTDSHNAGLGDWIFRQAAFPDQPDNAEKYFRRYFPMRTKEM